MSYSSAKLWGALVTLALVVLVGGVLVPLVAKGRVWWLKRPPTPDSAEQAARLKWNERLANKSGFSALLGADGRLSTSKTVAALWTVLVAYVVIVLILANPPDWNDALQNLSPNYLLLLGGPYAALVFAKAAVSSKVNAGTLQKPQGDGHTRLSDLVGDDRGQRDLVDIQFVLFNLVTIGFVTATVLRSNLLTAGLPDIPGGLITLTGGPAAVYVANKALVSNRAAVVSVMPSLVRANESFTIYGANFLPGATPDNSPVSMPPNADVTVSRAGATPETPSVPTAPPAQVPTPPVRQSGPHAIKNPDETTDDKSKAPQPPFVEVGGLWVTTLGATSTSVEAFATAPPGSANRPLAVSVVTGSGQRATLESALTVLTDPVLIALDRSAAQVNDVVTATGMWTSAPGITIFVLVGGLAAVIEGHMPPGTSLSFRVPAVPTPSNRAKVKLVVGGLPSNELELDVMS